jgi:hypothetical protein
VTPPVTYDLSLYHGKWYLYWGLAPLLFLWPFYLLGGVHASDYIFTMLGGLANVFLMYLCLRQVKRYFGLSLSLFAEVFLLLSYAFASPNFALSLHGTIWFTSQIFAATFLLLSLLFFFLHLNTGKNYQVLLSVAFFCLACLSRYSLIANGFLFLYLFSHRRGTVQKLSPRLLLTMVFIVLCFLSLGLFFNYLKFQNIFEVGERFVQGASRYVQIEHSGKIFSMSYLWNNSYYGFLNLRFSFSWYPLAIHPDPEGNSAFLFYPSLLLCSVPFLKYRQFDAKKRFFILIAGIAITVLVIGMLLYFADGWLQVGYRYLYDAFPLCFLLMLLTVSSVSENVLWILLIAGISINYVAILN